MLCKIKISRLFLMLIALLTTIEIILAGASQAQELSYEDIDYMSNQTTVLIGEAFYNESGTAEPWNPGSGVIVARNKNNYYVLTNTHVVKQPKVDGLWAVVTWDKKVHEVRDEGDNITRFANYQSRELPIEGFDLALVKFTSNNDYAVAVIGANTDIHINEPVYISGWPEPEENSVSSVRVFSPGKLNKIAIPDLFYGGYDIMYDNWTKPGMSGSPIFNQRGELIGVHAAGRRKDDFYCVDPDLNVNNSCGIQKIHLIDEVDKRNLSLAFQSPPVNPSVIEKGKQNQQEANVIEDVYKLFDLKKRLRDCPTGVLIPQPGCETGEFLF